MGKYNEETNEFEPDVTEEELEEEAAGNEPVARERVEAVAPPLFPSLFSQQPTRPDAESPNGGAAAGGGELDDLFEVPGEHDDDMEVDDLLEVDNDYDVMDTDEDGSLGSLVDVSREDIMGHRPTKRVHRFKRTNKPLPPTGFAGMR